jgi:hypothetical protein
MQLHWTVALGVGVAYTTVSIHLRISNNNNNSRDSVVGIATGYGLDDWEVGVRVPLGSRIFSSPSRPDRLWDLPNLLSNACRGSFPGLNRPGREADRSPPTSAEVKKIWIYTFLPPYAFIS